MGEQRFSWQFAVVLFAAWAILMFLLLPILVTIPVSFTPERYVSLPAWGEWSLAPYERVFEDDRWFNSMGQSLIIALVSTAIAVVAGTLASIGLWRLSSKMADMMRWLALAPLIVPPVVSALAFYQVFVQIKRTFGLQMLDSFTGMIVAHAILGVPFVVITVSTSLSNLDVRQEQAARSLGAGMFQTLWYVILPNVKPGMMAGAVFAFVLSWDEIVVTLFVTSRHIYTLPRRIWSGIRENLDPAIAAVATLLIAATVLAVIITVLLRSRRGSAESA